ncbi:MAG TPA: hypothetical protein VFT80_11325 [Actinomycetota bacterium]|nr:hypothetical protein [Actinomycetota bacterium]
MRSDGGMGTEEIRAGDIIGCFMQMEYGGELVLAIVLELDGSINRMGDGTPSPADSSWYIGLTQEPLFHSLMEVVPDDLFRYVGRLELPDRSGVDCKLSVAFHHRDGRAVPFEVVFGSESGGLPLELVTILNRALELTDPWWNAQPGRQRTAPRPNAPQARPSSGRRIAGKGKPKPRGHREPPS